MLQDYEFERFRLPPITSNTPRPTPRPLMEQPLSTFRPHSRVSPRPATVREEKPYKSLKTVARGHREWTTGLCDCRKDKRICLLSVFLPCMLTWDMAANLDECCCMPYLPGNAVALRTKTRALGGIKGSIFKDWLAMCFCPCLALSQTARELDLMAIQTQKYIQPMPE